MNEEAKKWVKRLPARWVRNFVVANGLWAIPVLIYEHATFTLVGEAILAVIIMGGCALGAFAVGKSARKGLYRLQELDDASAASAVEDLPKRYAGRAAISGLLLPVASRISSPDAWSSSGKTSISLFAAIAGAVVAAAAAAGWVIGLATRREFRRRLSATFEATEDHRPGFSPGFEDMQWFISKDGNQFGPVNSAVLIDYVARGVVNKDHLVWRQGMKSWVTVADLPLLLDPGHPTDHSRPGA